MSSVKVAYTLQDGPKNKLLLGVDNFVLVYGRKAYDMSKVKEFCPEKAQNLHVGACKRSLPRLHYTLNYAVFDKKA